MIETVFNHIYGMIECQPQTVNSNVPAKFLVPDKALVTISNNNIRLLNIEMEANKLFHKISLTPTLVDCTIQFSHDIFRKF